MSTTNSPKLEHTFKSSYVTHLSNKRKKHEAFYPYHLGLGFGLSFKCKTEPWSSDLLSISANVSWPKEGTLIHFPNRNDQR